MPLLRTLRPLSLLIALAGASTAAWAQSQPPAQGQARGKSDHASRDQRGLSDAVRRAERNGQVLSAEQVQYDGRDVNRVKIVDDRGRVRVYWDDPAAPQDRSQQKDPRGKRPAKARTHDDDDGDPTL